ncbi:stalk domain-containing protein [Paenibacillus sp. IHBB 10380]|uniref:stalk domain-containing protein n=1 Tax=Paenibacillus sp. IHBB 10380 TaxID=1566358 RepID=UPI0005D9F94B|nr:stalk domain-containing protein [Paenibacillus sp. IHBB 10380]AJS61305.1 copper amine oxidase [Paenibacillus sp. IHBB 10380]
MLHYWKKCFTGVTAVVLMSSMLWVPQSSAETGSVVDNQPTPYRIVALGDSLTVGFEPGLEDMKKAPYGFVDRLQEQGLYHSRTITKNYGIAGLKGTGLEHFVKATKSGQSITAEAIQPALPDPRAEQIAASSGELKKDLESADLITITIGGNDMSEILKSAGTLSNIELTSSIDKLFKAYTSNMTAVLDDLHVLNPDALIVVADQYQPVPEIADAVVYPRLIEASTAFSGVVDQLAATYQEKGTKIKVAHVAKEFVGGESTMTHILVKRDIHPNQLGYSSMAEVFAKTIWGEYLKPSSIHSDLPMTIVVKGKELNTPYHPVLRNNQNYVAIKDIVDAIGATSTWDNVTSSATITYGDRIVVIKIGSSTIEVNGQSLSVDTPAFLNKVGKESKTYVPLAALATGLGCDVQYSSQLRTAFINP